MDGEITVEFIKMKNPPGTARNGAVLAGENPEGTRMGHVKLERGHQVLLGAGNAYRFSATRIGVLMQQTMLVGQKPVFQGEMSWRPYCPSCSSLFPHLRF